jgi:tRNA(Ile)-lysidine synthase
MLVAFSGGPDSTALLLGLLEAGIKVKAAHFDHGLRPESAAEALKVAGFCRARGVELVSGIRRAPLAKGSLQAAARAARYRFLEEASAASGLATIAFGHTADDLVEGALLHLLRGAGLAGMRGMPERRGPFVRPLLEVWRTQVEDFLADRSVTPLRDPSNLDRRFARVRVRLDLLPRLEKDSPGLTARVYAAARRAADLQKGLEAEAAGLAAPGSRSASLAELQQAPTAVRAETFRRLHAAASGRTPSLQRRHLEALDRLLREGSSGATLDLPGSIRARRGYHFLELTSAEPSSRPAAVLRTRACSGCEEPAAAHFKAGARLRLGTRRPGLRMRPLPGGHTRKLQDILVDARVPRHLRDDLPLVFADGELAWVPGVAIDARWAAGKGVPSIHAEMVGVRRPLLESSNQLKEFFP